MDLLTFRECVFLLKASSLMLAWQWVLRGGLYAGCVFPSSPVYRGDSGEGDGNRAEGPTKARGDPAPEPPFPQALLSLGDPNPKPLQAGVGEQVPGLKMAPGRGGVGGGQRTLKAAPGWAGATGGHGPVYTGVPWLDH